MKLADIERMKNTHPEYYGQDPSDFGQAICNICDGVFYEDEMSSSSEICLECEEKEREND